MSSLISAEEISHEAELVWLEDIDVLDYVRQSLDRLPTRKGKPPADADDWIDVKDKYEKYFSPDPGKGE